MKIIKQVQSEVDFEVEVNIEIEDIVEALNQTPRHMHHANKGINNIYRFLSAIPDGMIDAMQPEKRAVIRSYLLEQSKRF